MMEYLFIDANIFLEVQLGQAHSPECEKLLLGLETPPVRAWTNLFLVFSMILIIQNKTRDIEKSALLFQAVNSYRGLSVFVPSPEVVTTTFKKQTQFHLDFDDALVLASMNHLKIKTLASFDKHFANIPDIEVLDPLAALKKMNSD